MSYLEEERRRAVAARSRLLADPGGGVYRGAPREFVLSDPEANLSAGLRDDVLGYFASHGIAWHGGGAAPPGHLLSSQVACVNHLGAFRRRQDAATALLRGIDPEVVQAEIVPEPPARANRVATSPDGYVAFEFIGRQKRLGERSFLRGVQCTSVDAAMMGRLRDGRLRLFLIEWKYTEAYAPADKYIPARAKVYDELIRDPGSPFRPDVAPRDL